MDVSFVTVEGAEVVRPTTDGVKEAIFSAIQFEIEGRTVLDLFAGSGQLWNRGAQPRRGRGSVLYRQRGGFTAVRENLKSTGLEANARGSEHAVFGVPKSTRPHSDTHCLQLQDNSEGASARDVGERVSVAEHEKECVLPHHIGRFEIERCCGIPARR